MRLHLIQLNVAIFFAALWTNTNSTTASIGDLRATFPFHSDRLLADPFRPYMYATVPSTNSLAIINTSTLTVAATIPLLGTPGGMALSPDGSALYVANTTGLKIDVINPANLTLTTSLPVATAPYDVAVGSNNRLMVMDRRPGGVGFALQLQQLDATTGAPLSTLTQGPGSVFTYLGNFQMSPDQQTLYWGQTSVSPTRLFAFDVSTQTTTYLRHIQTGANGNPMVLSHDGTKIAHPCGAPYIVPLLNSVDFSLAGGFNTGPYPLNAAFSPDDQLTYVSRNEGAGWSNIYVADTNTNAFLDEFNMAGITSIMTTDYPGSNLYISFRPGQGPNTTVVYDTGYIPEPASFGPLTLVAIALIRRRK